MLKNEKMSVLLKKLGLFWAGREFRGRRKIVLKKNDQDWLIFGEMGVCGCLIFWQQQTPGVCSVLAWCSEEPEKVKPSRTSE